MLTYIPSFLVKLLDKCYDHTELHILSYIINWSSVVINPIIYVVTQKKYQDALKYTKNAIISFCRRGSEEDRGQKMDGLWNESGERLHSKSDSELRELRGRSSSV